ncbi:hypothetical protein F5Y09DRAFT_300928 [Xylaria sp. FL1042]|nr:hypothetical protein F5Y09DRAFT_300928 [Xylaria sp. FL1042]
MLALLNDLMSNIIIGPERRKVKQYLDAATRDTVYADLAKILSWQLKRPGHLQEVFNKYCIEDPASHEQYWTVESFHDHVRSAHSPSAISDSAIALLWRSFHFYAYHPFPRDSQEHANVDFDAFRRAALLTVFQCDDLLGTRELDWYWRESGAFFRKAGFARIFRSIAISDHEFPYQQQETNILPSDLSDAMDVLVMIGPQFIHAIPSESQLESVARKLYADGPAVVQRNVARREDLSGLIDLLLRLRFQEEKWARSYHFGSIVEAEPAREYLTEALVNSLTERCQGQNINVQHLSEQMDLTPNLVLRFQQLWAVLFQPSGAADVSKLAVEEVRLTRIGRAISLFAPHIAVDHAGRQRSDEQDTRLALDTAQVSLDSQGMTMLRLRQSLSDHSTSHVVLFTSAADCDSPITIIGAYLPVPNAVEDTGNRFLNVSDSSHILFQLQPTFRLLRWAKREIPFTSLIHSEGKAPPDEVVQEEDLDLPYWIGAPQERGVGLRVDPRKRTATLTMGVEGSYVEIPVGGNEKPEESWKATVDDARKGIFILPSARNEIN